MKKEEVEDAPNVVTGKFSIKSRPVEILFNSGATHSFIYAGLVDTLRIVLTSKHSLLSIALPDA